MVGNPDQWRIRTAAGTDRLPTARAARSLECCASPVPAMTVREVHLKPGLGCEKQLLESGPSPLLKPAPLIDRHQHRRFDPALCDNLGPLSAALFEQLAEAGFRL